MRRAVRGWPRSAVGPEQAIVGASEFFEDGFPHIRDVHSLARIKDNRTNSKIRP